MTDLDKKLRKLITELDATLRKLAAIPAYSHIKPTPHPPATEEELKEYEAYLGRTLPPSYRSFLSLHNGYGALAYPGDMLSIRALMPGGAWHAKAREWKTTSVRYGAEEVADAIPIANLGQPNNWAYLDPNRINARTKEMKVVEWDPEDSDDYGSVVAFLTECLETARYGIAEASGLADDDEE